MFRRPDYASDVSNARRAPCPISLRGENARPMHHLCYSGVEIHRFRHNSVVPIQSLGESHGLSALNGPVFSCHRPAVKLYPSSEADFTTCG
jgi:hypothetical protein